MDESSKKLISSLEESCFREGIQNAEYKFYYLLYILDQLNIINFNKNNLISNLEPLKLCFPRYTTEYKELNKLGAGSFGSVYLSRYFLDNNSYAIKKIVLKDKNIYSLRKIISEIDIISKLDHPNIIRYYFSWAEPIIFTNNKKKKIFSSSVQDLQILSEKSKITRSKSYPAICHNLLFENNYNFDNESVEKLSNNSSDNTLSSSSNCDSDSDKKIIINETENKILSLSNKIKTYKNNYYFGGGFSFIFYIQMEYCENGNLEKYLRKRVSVDINYSLNIIKQIIQGVKYLHEESIIHRDLKPNNLFIRDTKIKIGDFGLSTVENNYYDLDNYDGCCLYYDKINLIKSKSNDIYSLGVIIFELLYYFKTSMERYHKLYNIDEKVLDECFGNSPKYKDLIMNCVTSDLERRFTINELYNYIENL